MSNTTKHLLERAVTLAGGQTRLAEKMGVTQQRVWFVMNRAKRVSAEMAIAIERATDRQISKHELRPDIFPKEARR